MKSTTYVFIALLLTACGNNVEPPTKKRPPQAIIEVVDSFFLNLDEKGAPQAMDQLFSTTSWINMETESMIESKSELQELISHIGKRHSTEIIKTISVGKTITHVVYISNYEIQPLRFKFTFYKPLDAWKIQNFQYDYEVLDELQRASSLVNVNQ